MNQSAPEIQASFEGIARLSESVASRDAQIQAPAPELADVSTLLADRSTDLVDLMQNSSLVFEEVERRKQAIHRLLVNARDLAVQLRGVATDNQAQIGPALREVDDLLCLLNSKEKELKATLNAARSLRLDPRQHHRHRSVVRRLRRPTSPRSPRASSCPGPRRRDRR